MNKQCCTCAMCYAEDQLRELQQDLLALKMGGQNYRIFIRLSSNVRFSGHAGLCPLMLQSEEFYEISLNLK